MQALSRKTLIKPKKKREENIDNEPRNAALAAYRGDPLTTPTI